MSSSAVLVFASLGLWSQYGLHSKRHSKHRCVTLPPYDDRCGHTVLARNARLLYACHAPRNTQSYWSCDHQRRRSHDVLQHGLHRSTWNDGWRGGGGGGGASRRKWWVPWHVRSYIFEWRLWAGENGLRGRTRDASLDKLASYRSSYLGIR